LATQDERLAAIAAAAADVLRRIPYHAVRAGDVAAAVARARTLAGRLGITLPDSMAAIDEASLDIDV
jgi:hypothetical protein